MSSSRHTGRCSLSRPHTGRPATAVVTSSTGTRRCSAARSTVTTIGRPYSNGRDLRGLTTPTPTAA
jgi:hypothetical protein